MEKGKTVLYKNCECVLIWEYDNGYCEIQLGEEVMLVHQTELRYIDISNHHIFN